MTKNQITPRGEWRLRGAVALLLPALAMVATGQTSGITSITPSPLDLSGTPVQVTISGTLLASNCNPTVGTVSLPPPAPVVVFGNTDVSSYVLPGASSTSINLSIPSSLLIGYAGTTITVKVTVYLSGDGCFQYSSTYPLPISRPVPAPVLNSASPRVATFCGPAFTMTMIGSNFQPTSILGFGQQGIQPYGWNPDRQPTSTLMVVTISLSQMPQLSPGSAFVEIATPVSSASTGYIYSQQQLFTVYATPVLQSITPTTAASGTAVTLQATIANYVPGVTQVKWGTSFSTLQVVGQPIQSGTVSQVTLSVPASLIPTPSPGATATVQVAVVNADDANPNGTLYDTACSPQKTFTVTNAVPLQLTTQAPVSEGEVNLKYSQTFAAIGGASPYAWSMTPAVPGLTLDPKSGILSGTPTAQSTASISVTVTDANAKAVTSQFPLTIYAAVTVPSPALPAGTVNVRYQQTLTAAGGKAPFTWSIPPGSTPPGGLALSSDGVLSWTPTTAGTFSFGVVVTDSLGGFAGPALSITINAAPTSPTFTTTSLPAATFGTPYSQRVAATGGSTPYVFSAVGMPSWMSLDASSGALTGTPNAPGTSNITFTVTDKVAAKGTQAITLTVNLPAPPSVTIRPSQDAQPTLSLNLGSGYPTDMMGTFTLTFTPNAAAVTNPSAYTPSDLLFASGGTSTTAKIVANSTTLTLPANQAVQLGSVAGTVIVTLTALTAVLPNGQTTPLTLPSPAPSTNIVVGRAAPVITGTVTITRTSSPPSFTVTISSAMSNTRDLTSASLTFHPAAGAQLTGTTTFAVPLNAGQPLAFWTTAVQGVLPAGTFGLQIPFNYTGDTSALGSVDVTLTNASGTSASKTGN